MASPLQPISDISATMLQIIGLAVFIIIAYVWISYHRWPTRGRFIGEVEVVIYGKGTRYGGNTVVVDDWTRAEWFRAIRDYGEMQLPEAFVQMVTSPNLMIYATRSDSAVDRFDRDFGKILTLSTEDIEHPDFHDNLTGTRFGLPMSKKRIIAAGDSVELGEVFRKGWHVFAIRPLSLDSHPPSETSKMFSNIPWDMVLIVVNKLEAVAQKSKREALAEARLKAEQEAHSKTRNIVRELQDKLDVATKALSKFALEGGDKAPSMVNTKLELMQAFIAAFIGYFFGTQILVKIAPSIDQATAGMIGILGAGVIWWYMVRRKP